MTEGSSEKQFEMEDILRRLEESRQALVEALKESDPAAFDSPVSDGESIRRFLERAADDLNFYYGRLTARALSLPQPPCITNAEFGSLREATMALQVAHRRFTNLLHDLQPEDLEKNASDPELGNYTLRQILELAAAQYSWRAGQIRSIAARAGEAG
jgi:hypothetical protein